MSNSGWWPQAEIKETEKHYIGNDGLQAVVLHVAADHGRFNQSVNWLWGLHNPKSSAHIIIDNATGRAIQMVSIHDRAWANGIKWVLGVPWSPASNRPILGAARAKMAKWIKPGVDPNKRSISVERSGDPGDKWSPAAMETLLGFLRYVASVTGIVYVPGDTLIGHRDVDPVGKAFCPGPHYDFAYIAQAANGTTGHPVDASTYVVVRGPARVRADRLQGTNSRTLRMLPTGLDDVKVYDIKPGQALDLYGIKSDQWAYLGDGWVWLPLLRRST